MVTATSNLDTSTFDASSYETVAKVIGDEMDKAWDRILQRLAQADQGLVPSSLQADVLREFVQNLGTANLKVELLSKIPKVQGYVAIQHTYQTDPELLGITGVVTGGFEIRF